MACINWAFPNILFPSHKKSGFHWLFHYLFLEIQTEETFWLEKSGCLAPVWIFFFLKIRVNNNNSFGKKVTKSRKIKHPVLNFIQKKERKKKMEIQHHLWVTAKLSWNSPFSIQFLLILLRLLIFEWSRSNRGCVYDVECRNPKRCSKWSDVSYDPTPVDNAMKVV